MRTRRSASRLFAAAQTRAKDSLLARVGRSVRSAVYLCSSHSAMIGAAIHGLVSMTGSGKLPLAEPGGTRPDPAKRRPAVPVCDRLAARHPGEALERLWGAEDDRRVIARPTPVRKLSGAFLADRGRVLLPGHMDKHLVGYHGGLDPEEVEIPVPVADR